MSDPACTHVPRTERVLSVLLIIGAGAACTLALTGVGLVLSVVLSTVSVPAAVVVGVLLGVAISLSQPVNGGR